MSAPWCGWTMLALLLCAVAGEGFQPGIITQAHTSVKVHQERVYKDAPVSILAQAMITLFRIGTAGMALCLCLPAENGFSFTAFAAVCGVLLGMILLKMLCNGLLDYTFQLSRRYGDAYEHYSNLWTLVTAGLYPLLLLFLRIGSPEASRLLAIVFAGLFVLLWLARCVQQFIRTPMALLYVLVYVATMEVLPIAGVVFLSAKTISNL